MLLASYITRTLTRLPQVQQVRHTRKTFRFQTSYGEPPLITQDDFMAAQESGKLEELSYKPIRFARMSENNSPLYDPDYERFVRFVMEGGRKALAHDLMHDTFYKIKEIQLKKLKRRQEREKEAAESGQTAKSAPPDELDEPTIETDPMVIFKKALKNCEPVVVTKKVKRGGAIYMVPYPLSASQSEYLSIKWLIRAVKDRPKPRTRLFGEVMASELIDASLNRGKVIKKRDDLHKSADANKAYAHYRWG